jgi:hypothetical protein
MSDEDRRQLAAAQAALVEALTAGAATPAEFDAARVALAAKGLMRKRARGVERTWPAAAAVPDFDVHFARFAATYPDPANAAADGLAFATWLLRERLMHDAGRAELLGRLTRRGWPVRAMRTADARGILVAVRWLRIGVRCYPLRLTQPRDTSPAIPTK